MFLQLLDTAVYYKPVSSNSYVMTLVCNRLLRQTQATADMQRYFYATILECIRGTCCYVQIARVYQNVSGLLAG